MIYVKDIEVLVQVMAVASHPRLLEVLSWICSKHDGLVYITSGHRHGDTGVHGTDPLRAVDLRSRIFQQPKAIEVGINKAWEYDPERPEKQVAWWHQAESGYHIHIQVHDNTRRRTQ